MRRTVSACALLGLVILGAAASAHAAFIPWDTLTTDSWIVFDVGAAKPLMHTANGGDYSIGFDQAATGNKARGMNALTFSAGGTGTDHRVATALTGSFTVRNGGSRTFSDLVLVAAVNAASLPADFSMSLGVSGVTPYAFDPAADFGYCDSSAPTGRPSGYYSITSPAREDLTYSFPAGMVTAFAAAGVNLGPSGGTVTFDYAFANLPGTAVFSVYAYDATVGWIYHTNRSVVDQNQAGNPSTFEVAPEPATLALVAVGAAAVFGRRQRCRRP
jgi:hypothetical protein